MLQLIVVAGVTHTALVITLFKPMDTIFPTPVRLLIVVPADGM